MTVRRPELERPELEVVSGDVSDRQFLAGAVSGSDAVISAYNPGWRNPDIYRETLPGLPAYYPEREGSRRPSVADRRRGRKPVRCAGGARDGPGCSGSVRSGRQGTGRGLLFVPDPGKGAGWVFFSPAANLVPGERTRKFRLGKDDLIRSVSGESRISVEDYAVAMIDELEKEMHHRERFTIGY